MSGGRRIRVDAAVYEGERFEAFGRVERLPGERLLEGELEGVVALVTRTVTKIDAPAIELAPDLEFVGSASAGMDHVDLDALQDAGIHFANAPGCNARAVAEWVVAGLMRCEAIDLRAPEDARVGIVGVGNVGRALRVLLDGLGVPYALCDPPEHAAGRLARHQPLDELRRDCEILSFHVPLLRGGPHPTVELLDADGVGTWLEGGKTLVNASRGEVLSLPSAGSLRAAPGRLLLDVWPGEPELDWAWMEPWARPACMRVGTPHIAGYTIEGKRRATQMVFDAMRDHFGVTPSASGAFGALAGTRPFDPGMSLVEAAADVACLPRDDAALTRVAAQRASGARSAGFGHLRTSYPLRRENSAFRALPHWDASAAAALGFLPAK